MIGVKNNSGTRLKARYDGQDYVFETDATTALSMEAAAHIFGYGQEDKAPALHRLGWVANNGQLESGLRRLSEFAFLAVEEVKFKDEPTMLMKAGVDAPPEEKAPNEAELEVAKTLSKPQGEKKHFGGR